MKFHKSMKHYAPQRRFKKIILYDDELIKEVTTTYCFK